MGFVTYPVGDDGTTLQLGGPGLAFITSQTFTAAASVSVNGCFTSAYLNYCVLIELTTTANIDIQYRMRSGGADASGSNYIMQYVLVDNVTSTPGRTATGTSGFLFNGENTSRTSMVAYFAKPAVAESTAVHVQGLYKMTAPVYLDSRGGHLVSTAYDGFTIYPASGTITGDLAVYGYQRA